MQSFYNSSKLVNIAHCFKPQALPRRYSPFRSHNRSFHSSYKILRFQALPRARFLRDCRISAGIAYCSTVRVIPRQYSLFCPHSSRFYPSEETLISWPSLPHDFSEIARYWFRLLTARKREFSHVDIRFPVHGAHLFIPRTKRPFPARPRA